MLKDVFQKLGVRGKDPLQIQGYQSYGTHNHLYLLGRALEHEGVDLEKSGLYNTMKNAWNQFKSDELANRRLRITLPDNSVIYTETNAEGYFRIDEKCDVLDEMANSEGWLNYVLSYDDNDSGRVIVKENRFQGQMLIPAKTAEYGVISDVDDTILETGVASVLKWRVILNTLFRGVANRSPLKGAAQLYQKMHLGKSGTAANPFFYVSNSPWNLYEYLRAFVKHNNFPKGAILLRDFRTPFDKTPVPEKPHKQREIRNILKTYPELQFVLIGDSGEHDADIYLEIAEEYPDRIKAIYLRSVNHEKKVFRVRGLIEDLKTIPAVLVEDSKFAEEHARGIGLIK
ncbi:MAG: phosphatase domain-containing protein [Leeuwenhoekiella sp.]